MSRNSCLTKNERVEKAVVVKALSVSYGDNLALDKVSLSIEEGEYLGIIGPNGGGKTTLLKAILGLVKPCAGEVLVYGKQPGSAGKLLGYVPQVTSLDKGFSYNCAAGRSDRKTGVRPFLLP